MDLLARETHRIVVRAMRRPLGTLGHMAAGQPCLEIGLGVHRGLLPFAGTRHTEKSAGQKKSGEHASSSGNPVAKSRRAVHLSPMWQKCSRAVACPPHRRDATGAEPPSAAAQGPAKPLICQ